MRYREKVSLFISMAVEYDDDIACDKIATEILLNVCGSQAQINIKSGK